MSQETENKQPRQLSIFEWIRLLVEFVEFILCSLVLGNINSVGDAAIKWDLSLLPSLRDLTSVWLTLVMATCIYHAYPIAYQVWLWATTKWKSRKTVAKTKSRKVIATRLPPSPPTIFESIVHLLMVWLRILTVLLVGYFTIVTAEKADKLQVSSTFKSDKATVISLQSLVTNFYMSFTYCIISVILLAAQQNAAFFRIGVAYMHTE
jgi:hypothetical protein